MNESTSTNPAINNMPSRNEKIVVWLLLALLAGLFLAKLSTSEPLRSANDRSRWCTVRSLVDDGTYQIDKVIKIRGWDTIDKVRHEGHFYSTKPPLFPTMLAGMYWTIKQSTGLTLAKDTETVTRIILFVVNIIPFLIAMYCLWGMMIAARFSAITRLLTLGFAAFTTMLTPFITVLNNHTVGATSLVFALYAAVKIFEASQKESASPGRTVSGKNGMFILCGFFAALTCCNELPAALFGLAIFLVLLRFDFKRTWLLFVPAALIPLMGFFITNYIATGGWKPFYMFYGTEKYVYEYLGVPSYWSDPRGVDKSRDSVATYIFHCLIGHHGVFSLSPILLLMLPGYYFGTRNKISVLRGIHFMGILLTVAIFAFYWKRTENYNYGGVSVALRWVLWLTPFWLLAIAETIETFRNRRWLPAVIILLGLPSLYSAWGPWQTPWQQPWIYNAMQTQGWINYSDPVQQFDHPLHTWFSKLSDSPDKDDNYWIEFSDGTTKTLRMEDAGPSEVEGKQARIILIEHYNETGQETRKQRLILDVNKFNTGKTPSEILLDWSDTAPEKRRNDQLTFLHGLPGNRNFREGRTRYLFHSSRKNAFKCQLAATRIVEKKTNRETRCDLWLSNELPFGVYRKQISVTNLNERLLTGRKTITFSRCGKIE